MAEPAGARVLGAFMVRRIRVLSAVINKPRIELTTNQSE